MSFADEVSNVQKEAAEAVDRVAAEYKREQERGTVVARALLSLGREVVSHLKTTGIPPMERPTRVSISHWGQRTVDLTGPPGWVVLGAGSSGVGYRDSVLLDERGVFHVVWRSRDRTTSSNWKYTIAPWYGLDGVPPPGHNRRYLMNRPDDWHVPDLAIGGDPLIWHHPSHGSDARYESFARTIATSLERQSQ